MEAVVVDSRHPFAADRAAVAGIPTDDDLFLHGFHGDGLETLKHALLKVSRGQAPQLLVDAYHARGATGRIGCGARLHIVLSEPVRQLSRPLRIPGGRALMPSHGDGTQPLGAHHGSQTCTTGCAVGIMDDVGEQDQALTRRATLAHANGRIAQLFANACLHHPGLKSPEMLRRAQFHMVVLHPEVDGLRRTPLEKDQIPAGPLELSPEKAAAL